MASTKAGAARAAASSTVPEGMAVSMAVPTDTWADRTSTRAAGFRSCTVRAICNEWRSLLSRQITASALSIPARVNTSGRAPSPTRWGTPQLSI